MLGEPQPVPPTAQLPPLDYAAAARAEAATRAAGAWSPRHLRDCWIALVVAAGLLGIAAAILADARAVWGVVLGTVVVGGFFTLSTVVISGVGRRWPARLMWAALGTYVGKMVALGIVLVVLPRDGAIDVRWMAGAVASGVLVWLGAHLRYVMTTKIFYVDPGNNTGSTDR